MNLNIEKLKKNLESLRAQPDEGARILVTVEGLRLIFETLIELHEKIEDLEKSVSRKADFYGR